MGRFGLPPNGSAKSDVKRGPATLLVGTAMSVRQLMHALTAHEPRPRLLGCLLPRPALLPLPVLGGFDQIESLAGRPDVQQVLVSLPAVMEKQTRSIAATLDRMGVSWRFLPTLADQLAGMSTPRHTGHVDPAELIDRRPRPLDEVAIFHALKNKTVLITGAGGSIGSELAGIVARFNPAKLVLVERSENALFEIDRQIGRRFPDLQKQAILHDVTQRDRTFDLVDQVLPQVIFHAAAHKHVPMMEDHPAEAVENNFYGTRSIADAADRCSCERFVMISTDKAVNPSSVMGATKRLAELYIRHLDRASSTTYCMVRFGNVLGSACSLIPIWTDQLAQGGPITVTHEQMTRYFMTIPEAAGLVLQAGAYAQGGEVFLLDMGKPIRILDMADRFLRMQGFEPNVDVKIQITGPRPGEKLFEELAYDGEDMSPTPHPSIRLWMTPPIDSARMTQIVATFDRLRDKTSDGSRRWRDASPDAVVTALRSTLPEMVSAVAG